MNSKYPLLAHNGPKPAVSPLCARSGRCLHCDIFIYGGQVKCLALRMKADTRGKE